MLAGEESIKVIAETLRKYGIKKTVIDPVCRALGSLSMLRYQRFGPITNESSGYGIYPGF